MPDIDRDWYIVLNHTATTFELLGPIKNGEKAARALVDQMLATDQLLADAVDWEHPTVCAPNPFYESLQVLPLSMEEVDMMAKVQNG